MEGSGCDDLPNTADAHRRGDKGKQQDCGENNIGRHRVSMLTHEVPAIGEVQNTCDRYGQDYGVEGLRDNHDEYGACLEYRHDQSEQRNNEDHEAIPRQGHVPI